MKELYEYIIKDGNAVITAYTGREKEIIVPAVLDGCPVTEIGEQAFYERKNTWGKHSLDTVTIRSLVLPDTVTAIRSKAFSGIHAARLVLPAGLGIVSTDAFFPFDGPERLFLPDGLSDISPFTAIASLTAFEVSGQNPHFSVRDGILYSADGRTLLRCPMGRKNKVCAVPQGVERIGRGAFADCREIERILLPDTVTGIGAKAFENCASLAQIELPSTLKTLGGGAFSHCGTLETVTVPDGVQAIGDNTFYHCTRLKAVTLPDSATHIGKDAFTLCRSLRAIRLPQGLMEISDRCFLYCSALERIELPETVTAIGEESFANCGALQEICLDPAVRRIGAMAFSGCTMLKAIELPKNLEELGRHALKGSGLHEIVIPKTVHGFQEWFELEEPILLQACGVPIEQIGSPQWRAAAARGYLELLLRGNKETCEIDAGYQAYILDHCGQYYEEALKNRPFMRCLMEHCLIPLKDMDELLRRTEDQIPVRAALLQYRSSHFTAADFERLEREERERQLRGPSAAQLQKIWETARTETGGYALLSYRGEETDIFVPASIGKIPVTEISHDCFSPWKAGLDPEAAALRTQIQSVYLPDSVTVIGDGAFRGCERLEKVRLSARLRDLGDCAFSQCGALKKVNLPERVEHMGRSVFLDCRGLADQDGFVMFRNTLFSYCGTSGEVRIPEGVEAISARAFEGIDRITSVIFPQSLRRIGEYAFSQCHGLARIEIPGNVVWIGRGAFFACTGAKTLHIHEGTVAVEDIAFRYCISMDRVEFPASLREIGVNAISDTDWPVVISPKGSVAERYANMYYLRTAQPAPHQKGTP